MLMLFQMYIGECEKCEITLVLSVTKGASEDRHWAGGFLRDDRS
jgi:hypothetical protein